MMRKILLVLLITALSTALMSCGIKQENVDESLAPVSSEESFQAESFPGVSMDLSVPASKESSVKSPAESAVGISKEQAIAIAKEYVLQKYNKSFEGYKIEAYDASEYRDVLNGSEWRAANDIWFVSYGLGAPAVYIWKVDGTVIACMLQSPAKTKEQAIAIAKEYVFQRYNKSFDEVEINGTIYRYEINVYDASDYNWVPEGQWLVLYMLADGHGGGPSVHIQKSNGRVIYNMLN